jgi:gliding motility-associated-like protein
LLIFNRWGEVIFESNNSEIGWDGTYGGDICQDGTYTWVIEFKELGKDKRNRISGHVHLLR